MTTIINSQYSMVISAIIGIASATYFWIIGPKNLVALVGVSVTFVAVSFGYQINDGKAEDPYLVSCEYHLPGTSSDSFLPIS